MFLLLDGVLAKGVLQLLLGLVHALPGGFETFSGGVLRGVLLLVFGTGVFALSAFPLFALSFAVFTLAARSLGPLPLAAFVLALVALRVLRLSVLALLLVLLNVLRQARGLVGDFPLLAGELLVVVAARGSTLDVLLLLDKNADRLKVLAQPGLFVLDRLFAVLAHQQIQERPQVLVEIGLIFQRPRKLILAEKLDEPLEPQSDQLFLALRDRLLEQGGAARIARGVELGHAQQHLFEMFVFLGDAAFLDGELFGRRGFRLLRNARGAGNLGIRAILRRLRCAGAAEAEQSMASTARPRATQSRLRTFIRYSFSRSRIFSLCRFWVSS